MKSFSLVAFLAVSIVFAFAQQSPPAQMMRYPAIGKTHICFLYNNDLWVVPRMGGMAMPLSSPSGPENWPRFSPDGSQVAFVANYEGGRDIYTMPVTGGVPKRITHHPGNEQLFAWMSNGRLLFSSSAEATLPGWPMIYTAASTGGAWTRLPVPYGFNAALSEDGRWLAYLIQQNDSATWKRYQGGLAPDVWLFDLQTKTSKRITEWPGNDTFPMWHGRYVYYLTDEGSENRLNLWRYDTTNNRREQVTRYRDFDVKWPSIGADAIVFQYGAQMMVMDLPSHSVRSVPVTIPGDKAQLLPRQYNVASSISSFGISPTGKRAVIEARGDVWSAPAKEGSVRNLTESSGYAERSPAWSPDGKWVAYLSDRSGDYEIWLTPGDGKGESKQVTRMGPGFRRNLQWSPDSKMIGFTDQKGILSYAVVETGEVKQVDKDIWSNPPDYAWSHDGKYIAYDLTSLNRRAYVMVYDVETGTKHQVCSDMFSSGNPTFDRKGEWLFYISRQALSAVYDDFGTNWIYNNSEVIIAVPLRKDVKNPFLPKSDEEPVKEEKKAQSNARSAPIAFVATLDDVTGEWKGKVTGPSPIPPEGLDFTMKLTMDASNKVTGSLDTALASGAVAGSYNPGSKQLTLTADVQVAQLEMVATIAGSKMTGTVSAMGLSFAMSAERTGGAPTAAAQPAQPEKKPEETKPEEKKPAKFSIDWDGIEDRSIRLGLAAGRVGRLAVNNRGHLLFTRPTENAIKLVDFSDGKTEEKSVAAGAGNFDISADGTKIIFMRGGSPAIQDASAGANAENVITAGMTAIVQVREEWQQVFNDVWRLLRDIFYDPGMHGVDWPGVRRQYEPLLQYCNSREDVGFVIAEMISELNAGHVYYNPGATGEPQTTVSVGSLGADYELHDGAYRITQIYKGAAWDSDERSPIDQLGVSIKVGDYILAVNGKPIDTSKDIWAAFIGTANRPTTITVSSKPTKDADAKDVLVRPMGGDGGQRYRWAIERNRKYVEEKTGGRVGYIYVPDTGINGQTNLVRQFYGQMHKDALIIDERWNGGGQIPTRFIELLNRPVTNYWARRDGVDWPWPPDAHFGPKCMLINGPSGSGGDAFPYYFKQAGLGKLIGTRTWGGLIGLTGTPGLIDGASLSVPTFGFYETDGTWGIEGHGVDPDIPVWDDPAKMQNGGDPQLDAAIQHMLDELRRNPYKAPAKPAYPDRSGKGIPNRDK